MFIKNVENKKRCLADKTALFAPFRSIQGYVDFHLKKVEYLYSEG